MRITHVITRLIVGGAQENTVASVLGLQKKPGLTVNLIAGPTTGPEGSLEALLQSSPHTLQLLPQLVRPVHPWKDPVALFRLTRFFLKERPDIVHTHSGKAGILGRIAAHRARVPLILHTIHGPSFGPFQPSPANWLFTAAERLAGRYTSHFITVAEAMTRQYLAAGIGRPEQYTRVFSGFDLDPFLKAGNDPALRRRLGLDPDDLVVGTIARLFKLKGHEDLLAVAPDLIQREPRLKFLWIGDGTWRSYLEEKIRRLGLARHFVFTGLIRPEEVSRYVGVMDILVHLSRREGLPRALPQALAAAKPVIAYDCDGASEVCRHRETGLLIPPGDLQQLTEALERLAENPQWRRELGSRGQALVRQWFPVEHMVDELYALYCKLADHHARLSV